MDDSLLSGKEGTAKLVYILYLGGLLTGGLTFIIGAVIAYINKDDADDWLQSHYHFQIRTFWIGTIFIFLVWFLMALGTLLTVVLIGFLIIPMAMMFGFFAIVWLVIRSIKGIKQIDEKQSHPNPTTWMFS